MPSTLAKTPTGIGRKAQIWNECETHGFQVRLYQTMVYEENRAKGTLTLDTGGWNTPTTARYINQALAYRGASNRVGIRKGAMVLYVTKGFVPFENNRLVIELQREKVAA